MRLLFLLIPLFCACLNLPAQTVVKLAVIDYQGAIAATQDGKKAGQELDAKVAPKNKEFQNRQSEIAQLQDQLPKGGSVMAEDKRNQLARDIDERKRRLERDMQDAEDDVRGEQQKLLSNLSQRMSAVIEKYAKDNGFTLILDANNQGGLVLWSSPSIDITREIVSLYDKTVAKK